MESTKFSKIKSVLASHPKDAKLLQEAGLVTAEDMQDLQTQEVMQPSAAKYYDLNKVKKEVLQEIGSDNYKLEDLEFEPGRYEYAYDFLGTLETACRTLGLQELGIEETDKGYKLGDQEASSIDELEFAEEALTEYADKIAKDINDKIGMPGVFFFGFNSDWGDGGYRLFYAFEDEDVPELQRLGAEVESPAGPVEPPSAEASFDQILSALEDEGCYDMARKLHSILREN